MTQRRLWVDLTEWFLKIPINWSYPFILWSTSYLFFTHEKFFALVIEMKVCLLPVLCPTHLHSEPLLSKKNKEWTQRNYQQPNAGGTTWQGAHCHRGYSRTLQGQNRERLEELVLNVVRRWAQPGRHAVPASWGATLGWCFAAKGLTNRRKETEDP